MPKALFRLGYNFDGGSRLKLGLDSALIPDPLISEEETEFSLVSVLFGSLEEKYNALPARLVTLSEFELCEEVDPSPSDYKLRQNFSDAVSVARQTGKKIRVASIYEDVVSRQTFFNVYMSNPVKVAFFTRPVVTHLQYYDALHKEGLRKLFMYVRNHDLEHKTMATFARIVEKAGDRVVGAVAQQINMNQKQLVHHTKSSNEVDVTPDNAESMQEKIAEMQARLNMLSPKEIDAKLIED